MERRSKIQKNETPKKWNAVPKMERRSKRNEFGTPLQNGDFEKWNAIPKSSLGRKWKAIPKSSFRNKCLAMGS